MDESHRTLVADALARYFSERYSESSALRASVKESSLRLRHVGDRSADLQLDLIKAPRPEDQMRGDDPLTFFVKAACYALIVARAARGGNS